MKDWPNLPLARGKHYLVAYLIACACVALLWLGLRAGFGEESTRLILSGVLGTGMGLAFIIWPLYIANGMGYIFWCMSKYTMLGKTEDSKRHFVVERPFLFRVFGVVILAAMALALAQFFAA